MGLGIWYPMGGMNKLADSFRQLAEELGVTIITNSPVTSIVTEVNKTIGVKTTEDEYLADIVIANADYHHVETELLPKAFKPSKNWDKQTMSPSGLLIYLGIDTKLDKLQHHNMFFDVDWDAHFAEVFGDKKWSKEPLFYVGAPSVTDDSVAPKGHENVFVLAPMASGVDARQEQIDETVDLVIKRLSRHTGVDLAKHIKVKHVRAHDYFKQMFNAHQGNAFGPAHTLRQSAIFRTKMQHKQIKNLYFVGQYTNPGTGVPLVTLSGKTVASLIQKEQA